MFCVGTFFLFLLLFNMRALPLALTQCNSHKTDKVMFMYNHQICHGINTMAQKHLTYGSSAHNLNPTDFNTKKLTRSICYGRKSWPNNVFLSVKWTPSTQSSHAGGGSNGACCICQWWIAKFLPDSNEQNDRKIKLNINLVKQYECLRVVAHWKWRHAYRKASADIAF